jgi:hypothetical protein
MSNTLLAFQSILPKLEEEHIDTLYQIALRFMEEHNSDNFTAEQERELQEAIEQIKSGQCLRFNSAKQALNILVWKFEWRRILLSTSPIFLNQW